MNGQLVQQQYLQRSAGFIGIIILSTALVACGSSGSGGDTPADAANPNDATGDTQSGIQESTQVPNLAVRTAIGDVIVGGTDNRSLYTFAGDVEGQSNCIEACAETWPPFTTPVAGEDEDFSTLQRADGSLQWTVRGNPLYFYAGDAGEGDVNGEGLGDAWYVARPDTVAVGSTELGETLIARRTINTGSEDPASRLDFDGRTLYVFDHDTAGISNCNEACADSWPPVYADAGTIPAPGFSVITRNDGTTQWAYDNRPLYLYAGDSVAGDITGHGVGDVWWAATLN